LEIGGAKLMMILISYDVSTTDKQGQARLRKIAKTCIDYGQRVQNSVFECNIDPAMWAVLKNKLIKIIKKEKDSLRFYYLGSNWKRRIEHIGAKPTIDLEEPLII
jgi:CRISPR-associated protein Cas2